MIDQGESLVIEAPAIAETVVFDLAGETVVIESKNLETVEVAEQGPPGPPAEDSFDADIALIYQISKL